MGIDLDNGDLIVPIDCVQCLVFNFIYLALGFIITF